MTKYLSVVLSDALREKWGCRPMPFCRAQQLTRFYIEGFITYNRQTKMKKYQLPFLLYWIVQTTYMQTCSIKRYSFFDFYVVTNRLDIKIIRKSMSTIYLFIANLLQDENYHMSTLPPLRKLFVSRI